MKIGTIRDGVIVLRPFTIKDANVTYLRWFNDSEIRRFIRYPPKTHAQAITYVRDCLEDSRTFFFAVCLARKPCPKIGTAKLTFDSAVKTATLGLMIGSKWWRGRGLGRRIIGLACRYAFERLGCEQVVAGIDRENHGSVTAFARSGFDVWWSAKRHGYWALLKRP